MLFKINVSAAVAAAAARGRHVTPVFKLKRTRREIQFVRNMHQENPEAGVADAVMSSWRAFDLAYEMRMAEEALNENHSEAASTTSDDPDEEVIRGNVRQADPPAYIVSHPWHIIDYHLYLCSAERGRTEQARLEKGTFLFDGVDCRALSHEKFKANPTLSFRCVGNQRHLLFGVLPIADRRLFGDRTPSFNGQHYVLGFDFEARTLYARHFDWFPHDLTDAWCVWDGGHDTYTLTVPDLMQIMEMSICRGDVHVGMGILSSSPYCEAWELNDDPGLELVIGTLWCQWLLDFCEIIFQPEAMVLSDFKKRLTKYIEQGRLILQRASYRAWFAVRDGISKDQYKCNMTINQYTNDLYTYEKSVEEGSLKGRDWAAPGLDTCDRIRADERMRRKKRTEQRLEDVFISPESEDTECDENVFKSMWERSQPSMDLSMDLSTESMAPPVELPRTPSPRIIEEDTPALSERSPSPDSPDIVAPATRQYDDGLEPTEYHHIPVPVLMERTLELIRAHPEMDTLANRGQLGSLLARMGIGLQQSPLEYFHPHWRFDGHLGSVLLPSPDLD